MDGWSLEKVYHHRLNWKPVTFGLLNLVFDSCLVCFAKLALCLKGFRIRQRVDSQTMFGASCPRLSTVMMDMTLIPSPTPTIQIQETEPRSPESSRCGSRDRGVLGRVHSPFCFTRKSQQHVLSSCEPTTLSHLTHHAVTKTACMVGWGYTQSACIGCTIIL